MRDQCRETFTAIKDWKKYLEQSKTHFEENYFKETKSNNLTKEDFDLLQTLGVGSFGRVFLAKKRSDDKHFAVKVVNKAKIWKLKQVKHSYDEKRVLQAIRFPFCVHLEEFFQDNVYIYYVMPLVLGGELSTQLKKLGKFDESRAKFYGAQIVLALEYLHNLDLVYRDLKPENILLDHTGFVKITDFGFCKFVKERTFTLCGTTEYIAPEVILSKGYGKSVDWWSFGVLMYEIVSGNSPFSDSDKHRTYAKIVAGKYRIPNHFSSDLRELIVNTLQTDISRRCGAKQKGVNDVKNLRWFKAIQWVPLLNKKIDPPYIPKVKNIEDTSNFEKYNNTPLHGTSHDEFAEYFADF